MKRFLNLQFLLALFFGAGLIVIFTMISHDDDDGETLYGEPDGEISENPVPSLVD